MTTNALNWSFIAEQLSGENLFWLASTIIAYMVALFVFKFFRCRAIFHPILLGTVMVVILCAYTETSIDSYRQSMSVLNWLLGPATVALAIPLYRQISVVIRSGVHGLLVILIGGILAPLLTLAVLHLFGFSEVAKLSTLTKSITTPLAMDTTLAVGGIPELAAAIVIVTGIFGAMVSQWVFKWAKCNSQQARGLALGTVAHAVGTSRALQMSEKTGAFSTMALCINGIVTAIIIPIMFALWG